MNWEAFLRQERKKAYFSKISTYLDHAYREHNIYPKRIEIFEALKLCPLDKVRVVILGQDPYHTPDTAHGLAFSTKQRRLPPSLRNILLAVEQDIPGEEGETLLGNLTHWAHQGILLLNAILTVEQGRPGSHTHIGWQTLTGEILKLLNDSSRPIIFLLWGKVAANIANEHVTSDQHYRLYAPHPSPLSARRGFLQCRHFSQVNQILQALGDTPIKWWSS